MFESTDGFTRLPLWLKHGQERILLETEVFGPFRVLANAWLVWMYIALIVVRRPTRIMSGSCTLLMLDFDLEGVAEAVALRKKDRRGRRWVL